MKAWMRGIVACFIALAVIVTIGGAALAKGKDVPTDPADYHAYLYEKLSKEDGKDFLKHIPGFSSHEFQTPLDAYSYVIGLASGGYAEDMSLWGQEDYWGTSRQVEEQLQGDCEDWAIFLASLLRFHTKARVDAYVAVGQLTWPSSIEPGTGGSPTAPPTYSGAHAWVVIPAQIPGLPDAWMILDPVYYAVAASEGISVPYFDPDWNQTFYVSPNGVYLEAFRFNNKTTSGFVEALLMG